jgi:hypothetical protein
MAAAPGNNIVHLAAAPAASPALAADSFTLQPFDRSDVLGALAQLLLLLDASSAADELVEWLHASAGLLAGLQGPAGQQDAAGASRLQLLQVHYTTVQIWARRGRFDKAAAAVDAMLRGLGL